MKIGSKDGKVCIIKADLPITIDIERFKEEADLYTIKEVSSKEYIRFLSESIEQKSIGTQLQTHVVGFIEGLKQVDDEEITKAWCKKLFRLLISEKLITKEDLQ
jgi:hypothetical protein